MFIIIISKLSKFNKYLNKCNFFIFKNIRNKMRIVKKLNYYSKIFNFILIF